MTPEEYAATLTARLFTEVGAFFCNTRRGMPGICAVCTGPATAPLCPQCRNARDTYGSNLADLVVTLAYAKGRMSPTHQSEHHVYSYKRQPPAPKCVQDLHLMMLAGTWLHGACIAHTVGWWQVVTFVPSATRPGLDHPVAGLARQVHSVYPNTAGILLGIGPGYHTEPHRFPRPDRFTVPATPSVPTIAGQHVLVVDDTWVSGDKAQSAALALKGAGAARVTIFSAARWLRNMMLVQHAHAQILPLITGQVFEPGQLRHDDLQIAKRPTARSSASRYQVAATRCQADGVRRCPKSLRQADQAAHLLNLRGGRSSDLSESLVQVLTNIRESSPDSDQTRWAATEQPDGRGVMPPAAVGSLMGPDARLPASETTSSPRWTGRWR